VNRRACCITLALLAGACASPEASRARGGGKGSGPDIGRLGGSVEMHAGAEPYFGTPCVTLPVECSGPPPRFGGASE
jgi:hypothetical protein